MASRNGEMKGAVVHCRKRPAVDNNAKWQKVKVNTRVAVLWPDDNRYYPALVKKVRGGKHFLEYHDGDNEWIDLRHEKFRFIDDDYDNDDEMMESDEEEAEEQEVGLAAAAAAAASVVVGRLVDVQLIGASNYQRAKVTGYHPKKNQHTLKFLEDGNERSVILNKLRHKWVVEKPKQQQKQSLVKQEDILPLTRKRDAVGRKLEIYSPKYDKYYAGKIIEYVEQANKHKILFRKGKQTKLVDLQKHKWRFTDLVKGKPKLEHSIIGTSRFICVQRQSDRTWSAASKNRHIGTFLSEREAALAYDVSARKANLPTNFQDEQWTENDIMKHKIFGRSKLPNCTSKYRGVSRKYNRWEAVFCKNYLGRFTSERHAALAVDAEMRRQGWPTSQFNFPNDYASDAQIRTWRKGINGNSSKNDEDCVDAARYHPRTRAGTKRKHGGYAVKPRYPVGTELSKKFVEGWFKGFIASFDGERYTVHYEDGDVEQLTEDDFDYDDIEVSLSQPSPGDAEESPMVSEGSTADSQEGSARNEEVASPGSSPCDAEEGSAGDSKVVSQCGPSPSNDEKGADEDGGLLPQHGPSNGEEGSDGHGDLLSKGSPGHVGEGSARKEGLVSKHGSGDAEGGEVVSQCGPKYGSDVDGEVLSAGSPSHAEECSARGASDDEAGANGDEGVLSQRGLSDAEEGSDGNREVSSKGSPSPAEEGSAAKEDGASQCGSCDGEDEDEEVMSQSCPSNAEEDSNEDREVLSQRSPNHAEEGSAGKEAVVFQCGAEDEEVSQCGPSDAEEGANEEREVLSPSSPSHVEEGKAGKEELVSQFVSCDAEDGEVMSQCGRSDVEEGSNEDSEVLSQGSSSHVEEGSARKEEVVSQCGSCVAQDDDAEDGSDDDREVLSQGSPSHMEESSAGKEEVASQCGSCDAEDDEVVSQCGPSDAEEGSRKENEVMFQGNPSEGPAGKEEVAFQCSPSDGDDEDGEVVSQCGSSDTGEDGGEDRVVLSKGHSIPAEEDSPSKEEVVSPCGPRDPEYGSGGDADAYWKASGNQSPSSPRFPIGTKFLKNFMGRSFEGRVTSFDGRHYKVFYPEDSNEEYLSDYEFDSGKIEVLAGTDDDDCQVEVSSDAAPDADDGRDCTDNEISTEPPKGAPNSQSCLDKPEDYATSGMAVDTPTQSAESTVEAATLDVATNESVEGNSHSIRTITMDASNVITDNPRPLNECVAVRRKQASRVRIPYRHTPKYSVGTRFWKKFANGCDYEGYVSSFNGYCYRVYYPIDGDWEELIEQDLDDLVKGDDVLNDLPELPAPRKRIKLEQQDVMI